MSKVLCSGFDLSDKIKKGVNTLADNVASTLGPRGRNVLLQSKGGTPIVTKDGVTVAKFLELADPVEDAAASVIKQAAARTNVVAGDGTTTSTVLARRILISCLEAVEGGTPPVELKRELDGIVDLVSEELHNASRPIESERDVAHIATISANNDASIGELIALAVDKVGKNGSITIEEGRSSKTSLDLSEGFNFDSGYAAQAFVTDDRRSVIKYDNPIFLITDTKLDSVESILPALEIAAREGRPFIIVADDITGQALAALIMNSIRGTMKVAAIKAPRYGHERTAIMDDLAVTLGAKYFRSDMGDSLAKIDINDFGTAKYIEVSKNSTTISGTPPSASKNVQLRIDSLESQLSDSSSTTESTLLQERIVRLASAVAVIRVGGSTQVEMIETKHRIEDALEAVNAALADGILPGGGTALLRSLLALEPSRKAATGIRKVAFDIISEAAMEPLIVMSDNAGEDASKVIGLVKDNVKSASVGYNFLSGEVCDLYDAGVVDPVKVAVSSLVNAASAATTLMTTKFSIIED